MLYQGLFNLSKLLTSGILVKPRDPFILNVPAGSSSMCEGAQLWAAEVMSIGPQLFQIVRGTGFPFSWCLPCGLFPPFTHSILGEVNPLSSCEQITCKEQESCASLYHAFYTCWLKTPRIVCGWLDNLPASRVSGSRLMPLTQSVSSNLTLIRMRSGILVSWLPWVIFLYLCKT